MSWIDDNKNAGPWDFMPQADRAHYNEGNLISGSDDPVWSTDHLVSDDPLITPTHDPHCGYWTKKFIPKDSLLLAGNIYGVTGDGGALYSVYFDGRTLKWVGKYITDVGVIRGLAWYDERLITIQKSSDIDARLYHIDPATLQLCDVTYPFNYYDITRDDYIGFIRKAGSNILYACSPKDYTIIKFQNLQKQGRGHLGIVRTGTDGNKYVLHGYRNPNWCFDDRFIPVTGANWTNQWTRIPDNRTKSPCLTLIPTPPPHCDCGFSNGISGAYYDNYLYTLAIGAVGGLKKIDNYETEIDVSIITQDHLAAGGSKLFVAGGAGGRLTVKSYDAGTLILTGAESSLLTGYTAGIVYMNGYLYFLYEYEALGIEWGLLRLDPDTLEVNAFLPMQDSGRIHYHILKRLDSVHLVAGRWDGLCVINTEHMYIVDDINLEEHGCEEHNDIMGMYGY